MDDGAAVHRDGRPWRRHARDPFAALDALADEVGVGPDGEADPVVVRHVPGGDTSTSAPADGPAGPGAALVGVLSYDLARRIESLDGPGPAAVDDRGLPLLDLQLAEVTVTVTPRGELRLTVDDRGGDGVATARRHAEAAVHAALASGRDAARARSTGPATPSAATTATPRLAHLAAVRRVLEHVAAGDTFQVNLSHRLSARWDGDAVALHRALRAASPAAYCALARLGEASVASISPETFLVARGRDVVTRPIKGTRARADDPELDAALADDLLTSAKDRAENVMVVDMERNDLGRVCVPGSVRVPELLVLEAHPTVWHLVSTVRGQLREGIGWGGLLRATFPCGSVTGTPKVRAMQVIEALEPVRRHAYCGAIGLLGAGRLDLSVAIRTATLMRDGTVDYGAGGGIVADSDPADEWDETIAKAAAFLAAVGASPHGRTS